MRQVDLLKKDILRLNIKDFKNENATEIFQKMITNKEELAEALVKLKNLKKI